MNVFFGQVPVSPVGYKWDGIEELNTEDYENDDATQWVILKAVNHDELMQRFRELGHFQQDGEAYDPFVVEPALFRIFSELPLDPQSILKFANRYGDVAWLEDVVEEGGASLLEWQTGIVSMMDWVYEADKLVSAEKPSRTAKQRASEACEFINFYLGPRTFLSASVVGGKVVLRTMATDLMAVMMIQLALSIIGQKRYRDCDFCGKPFELTPQINRSDRLFCTDNCRVKAHQRRKRQAISLHSDGRTLKQIIEETGADRATVKRWIDASNAR